MTMDGLIDFQQTYELDIEDIKHDFRFPEIRLENFGIDLDAKDNDDDVPSVPKETIIKLGDFIELGRHKLLCADSTLKQNIDRLLGSVKAEVLYTDPPYGIKLDPSNNFSAPSRKAKGHNFPKILGDQDINTAIKIIELTKDIPVQILWGANYYCHSLSLTANWLVWDKREEDKERDNNSDCELAWVKCNKHSARIFRHKWKGMIKASEQGQARVHPTQKPVALAVWCFEEYAKDLKIILDLFLGSGSGLIACEKTDRTMFGMELDEHYCDVIINRYCDYTKNYNIKINGIETVWKSGV
jgi:site-specific DNA-methyltransferase (adenine-specific)/modification methylase